MDHYSVAYVGFDTSKTRAVSANAKSGGEIPILRLSSYMMMVFSEP